MITHAFNPKEKELSLGVLLYIFHDCFDKHSKYELDISEDNLSITDGNGRVHEIKTNEHPTISELCNIPYSSDNVNFLHWLWVYDPKIFEVLLKDCLGKHVELSYDSGETAFNSFTIHVDGEKWHNININNDTLISCYGIYVNYVMGRDDLMVTSFFKENVYIILVEGELNQPILKMAYFTIRQGVFQDIFDEDIMLSASNIKHHLKTTIQEFEN